jgi:hypothetical protein
MRSREILFIDEFFAGGAQHNVARLKGVDGKIVKIPHEAGAIWDRSTDETVKSDVDVLKQERVSIPGGLKVHGPSLLIDDEGKQTLAPYAIEMNWVDGRIFRERDLQNPELRERMEEVLLRSHLIRSRIGAAIDFLGGEAAPHFLEYFRDPRPGQLGAYNFRITEWDDLILIDTNLLDPLRVPQIVRPFINSMIDLQHSLMAELIGSESLKRDIQDSNHFGLIQPGAKSLYQFSRVAEAVKRTFTPPQIPLG